MNPRGRVVLICMPMGLVQVPNLGLSLLKAALVRAEIPCTVRYFSLELLDRFFDHHDAIQRYVHFVDQPPLAVVGASRFSARRFGDDPVREALVNARLAVATEEERDFVARLDAAVDPFLDYCVTSEDWETVAIAGFTSLYAGMTVPSATLAARLKARFPGLTTVLGGWNTGSGMGEVIAERLEEFDYVLRGEADRTFVRFCQEILSGGRPNGIPGLVVRDRATGAVQSWPQEIVRDLDELPFPDFADYYTTFASTRFLPGKRRSVPFETSRGCWKGQDRTCRFCGLNGPSALYRSKSPARTIAEIDHLVERYSPDLLFAADTVLDRSYFREVLPHLRRRHPKVSIAYELKAPVTRQDMMALSEAGVDLVTVGIESLSSRVLGLMDKGTTSLQNLHSLRLAAEFGVRVGWQFLYGFPGERLEDYEAVARDVPWFVHLSPPMQACRIILARFSPFFDRASELGIARVRAHSDYRLCFSWPQADLDRVAYLFDFEPDDGRDEALTPDIDRVMTAAATLWNARQPAARLDLYRGSDLAAIVDTRFTASRVLLLAGLILRIHDRIDGPATVPEIVRVVSESELTPESLPGESLGRAPQQDAAVRQLARRAARELGVDSVWVGDPPEGARVGTCASLEERVQAALDTLVECGLARAENGRYLSLAVPRTIA